MKDFDICMGTGDIPTPDYDDDEPTYVKPIRYSKQEIQEMINKGLIQDSTGKWYDPNNYIDCLYADW